MTLMRRAVVFVLVWSFAASAAAQGVQTGVLRGTVVDAQELAVPGVTVTVTSPALQGSRSTVSGMDGAFAIGLLPPGEYEVQFAIQGFAPERRSASVPLGQTADLNVSLRVAAVSDKITVTATPLPLANAAVGPEHPSARSGGARHVAEPARHRDAVARRQRIHAGSRQQQDLDQRRAVVRQPVHGQRRRRQRQHHRSAAGSVHRRGHRGDAGPDVRASRPSTAASPAAW